MTTKRITDNHTYTSKHNVIGFMGPKATTFTMGWLTLHRRRFCSFMAGTQHFFLIVGWDRKGPATVEKSDEDVAAMRQLIWGDGIKFAKSDDPEPYVPVDEMVP